MPNWIPHTARFLIAPVALAMLATEAPAQQGEPIRIGTSLPLTGSRSVNGEKHRKGFVLCVEMINESGGLLGRPVELIVSDNRSDAGTAIAQYERLINVDQVDLIFGTFSSALTYPISAVTNKYNMVMPVPSGGSLRIWTQGFPHIFYFQQNNGEYLGRSISMLINERLSKEERPRTAAIVGAEDDIANSITAGLMGLQIQNPGGDVLLDLAPGFLADAGIEVIYHEKWPEEGFSDWLTIANNIKRSEAELVIGLGSSPEEAVQLMRALKTVQAKPKMVYLSQGTQHEYKEGLGDIAEATLHTGSWQEDVPWIGLIAGEEISNQEYQEIFEERWGVPADEDSAIPFAACQGMEQAVRATGTTDNLVLSEWLHARTKEDPVRTVLGPFQWDERGVTKDRSSLVTQWQGDELKLVFPTDEFEGAADLIYPKPEM
ncbi:MAG TPA: amino acid ABC transporter substrate-binding protein [Geminicoccaceae bacterium]|nr:amino acid ABC transporter substrate-binding protein [Geminicoccaceae bacterium]